MSDYAVFKEQAHRLMLCGGSEEPLHTGRDKIMAFVPLFQKNQKLFLCFFLSDDQLLTWEFS